MLSPPCCVLCQRDGRGMAQHEHAGTDLHRIAAGETGEARLGRARGVTACN